MKILVENTVWRNVGDGFYQNALFSLIKQACPAHDIFIEEGPVQRAFNIRMNRIKNNPFQLMDHQKADIHIFSGPIIPQILTNYKQKIINIINRGDQYVLISVSAAGISEPLRLETGQFLKRYPPLFFSSRDEDTYFKFKDFVGNIFNGICTAFLVDKTLDIDKFELLNGRPFFISSFYQELEPVYKMASLNREVNIEDIDLDRKKTFIGLPFDYARHLNFFRPQQTALNNYEIIRVHQDFSTHYYHIKFSHPNSFMSYNPLSYLSIYKSAAFTISDRVHACAVSLAFGKPARFMSATPRAGIFDRLGFNNKNSKGIMYPNSEVIDMEYDKLTKEIKKYF